MRVIICGIGVAALTLAVRLGHAGWEVLLLERDGRAPKSGYLIDICGPGYNAVERLDLLRKLEAMRHEVPEIVWLDQCGEPVAQLHRKNFEEAVGGPFLTLMRADLEQTLLAALTRSTEIRFAHTVEDIDLRRDCVRARLSDGTSESADLLVGADGMHSKVRELLLGDTELPFRSLGLDCASFLFEDTDIHAKLAGRLAVMSVPGSHASLFPLRGGGQTAAFFAHRMVETDQVPHSPALRLSEQYKSFGWVMPAVLQHARAHDRIYYDSVGQIELSRWSFGRVALLGDACQPSSVVAGRGASLAMHAASVLADELAAHERIPAALESYERRLKPTIERTRERRRRNARWFVPATWPRLVARNAAVRLLDHPHVAWMLRPILA